MDNTKICKVCNQGKPVLEFRNQRKTCRACIKKVRIAYNKSERGSKKNKEWKINNKERLAVRRRARYAERKIETPNFQRDNHYKKTYGINLKSFFELLSKQNNKCAICKSDDPKNSFTGWNVDHDHTTGNVRGILCHPCNLVLGSARENIFVLQRCLAYLRFHKKLIHWDKGTSWGGVPQGGLSRAA